MWYSNWRNATLFRTFWPGAQDELQSNTYVKTDVNKLANGYDFAPPPPLLHSRPPINTT